MPSAPDSPVRVLTFSTLFPNPLEPLRGQFVRHRMVEAACLDHVRLISPVASTLRRRTSNAAKLPDPRTWSKDGNLEVCFAPWLNLPGVAATGPALMLHQVRHVIAEASRGFRPQVLDAQFGYPDGPAVASLARTLNLPYTITLRGSELLHSRYPFRRRQLARAVQGAAALMPVSPNLHELALDLGADPKRLFTVPNGVDSRKFFKRQPTECRKAWQVADGTPLILAAGNLIKLKGFHRLILAASSLIRNGAKIQLFVVGPGGFEPGYERTLRQLPNELGIAGSVRFCGPVTQDGLAQLMSAADLFVLASDREGWPNVVHEALACGTPVVATAVGGVPELLSSPACGIVIPPGDVNALASSIARGLSTSWNRFEISRIAHARDWQSVGREVSQIWRSVIAAERAFSE